MSEIQVPLDRKPDGMFFMVLGAIAAVDNPRILLKTLLPALSDGILPELNKAKGCMQNSHHVHDVFDHTVEVVCATKPDFLVRTAALFHDLGKVYTRKEEDGRVTFHGHEEVSARIARAVLTPFVSQIGTEFVDSVAFLCDNHMKLKSAGDFGTGMSNKALQRLKQKCVVEANGGDGIFEKLLDLCHADNISHAPDSCMPNQVRNLRRIYAEIGDFVPRNVHAKPIQAMFDEFLAHRPTQERVKELVWTSKGMVHQKVNMVVGLVIDFVQLESTQFDIPGDQVDNYAKAFHSRVQTYVEGMLEQ